MREDGISSISCCVGCVIVFICDFSQLWAAVRRECGFRFAGRGQGCQRLPSPATVLRATLDRKALYVDVHIPTESAWAYA